METSRGQGARSAAAVAQVDRASAATGGGHGPGERTLKSQSDDNFYLKSVLRIG